MRYMMKKKMWSIGNDFTIKDADGRDAFFIDGKALSLRDQMIFEDATGNHEQAVSSEEASLTGDRRHGYHNGQ